MNPSLTRIRHNPVPTLLATLYVIIAAATFRHSALGFATLEGGSFAWGALSALAIDAGMLLSASALRQRRDKWLALGLILSALVSTYTQLLHSIGTAGVVEIAPGAEWLGGFAVTVANVRVLLLPATLPALSIIFAFAVHGAEAVEVESVDLAKIAATLTSPRARADLFLGAHPQATTAQVIKFAGCKERTVQTARKAALATAVGSTDNGGSAQ